MSAIDTPITNGTLTGDTLDGTSGDDTLQLVYPGYIAFGHNGNDSIIGSTADDIIIGGSGQDTLAGGDGNDTISGGMTKALQIYENGTLTFIDSATDDGDSLSGGGGNDYLQGNTGDDTIDGGTGNDTIHGGRDNDNASGGDGSDSVMGDRGDDTLFGNAGDDTLFGGTGNDELHSGRGNDLLLGGDGNDTIYIDAGAGDQDTVTSGAGDDVIIVNPGAGGTTHVTDFQNGDKMVFSDALSSQLNMRDVTDAHGAHSTLITYNGGQFILDGVSVNDILVRDVTGEGAEIVFGSSHSGGVDHAPVNSVPGAQSLNQDTSLTFSGANGNTISVSDSDNAGLASYQLSVSHGTLTLATTSGLTFTAGSNSASSMTFSGSISDINTALATLRYDPANGYSGVDTLTITANDGTLSDTDNVGISIAHVGNGNIVGTSGNDILIGGTGDDTIYGMGGADVVTGGAGNNVFKFAAVTDSTRTAPDTITDFHAGDLLDLHNLAYDGFGTDRNQLTATYNGAYTIITANGSISGNTFSLAIQGDVTSLMNSGSLLFTADSVGTAGDDTINGQNIYSDAGNDSITGVAGGDVIYAGAGDDTVVGGADGDTIAGGDGNDSIDGGNGNNYINSNAGNDIVVTGSGADNIAGGAGDDTIDAGAGADYIEGGTGNDSISGGNDQDIIYGGAGADTLDGGAGVDYLGYIGSSAGVNVDILHNTASGGDAQGDVISNFEILIGSAYNDTLTMNNGGYYTYGFYGNDSIIGGTGNDTIYGDKGGLNTGVTGVAGDDTIDAGIGNNYVYGEDGNDSLMAGAGNDTLEGGNGNDTILAGDGTNRLYGEDGNDSLVGGSGSNTFYGGAGADTMVGNGGTGDYVDYTAATSSIAVDLSAGTGSLGDANGDSISNIENVTGSNYADTIIGDNNNNILYGVDGNDSISGGGGNDIIYGGKGSDTLDGGAGAVNTTGWLEDTTGVNINVLAGTGTGGTAQGDIFANFQQLIGGQANDTIDGSGVATMLRLHGLYGNDSIIGGDAGDLIHGDEKGIVSGYAGVDGNDTISSGAGADTIYGDGGNDSLMGGAGTDNYQFTFDGTNGADTVSDADGGSIIIDGNTLVGAATVTGNHTYSLTIGGTTYNMTQDNTGLTITKAGDASDSVFVQNFDNTHWGFTTDYGIVSATAGNDTIAFGYTDSDGDTVGNSADVIHTGDGNDLIYATGGADTIDGGNDIDAISYFYDNAGENINLITGNVTGGLRGDGDLLSNIEQVSGSTYNDTITAGAGGETLYGGGGDDSIIGGGNTLILGGVGADTIIAGSSNDTASYYDDTVGVNVDLLNGTASGGEAQGDSLSGIENLVGGSGQDTLSGDNNANSFVGNGSSDMLTGLGGNDTLEGDAGNDTLLGGDGNDSLIGGTGADHFVFSGAAPGNDTIGDFSHAQSDLIDLSAYGAVTFHAGGAGVADLTSGSAQASYQVVGGDTVVYVDINGDNNADFNIHLTGVAGGVVSSDFIL